MAMGKVEICGVNTAKLPLLKNEEKEALFAKIAREIKRQGRNILKEI